MWRGVPLLLRALLTGIAVTGTATLVWGALVQWNLRWSPQVPWATAFMALFLIFYWRFLKGSGWPRSTAAARHAALRAKHLSSLVWRRSLVAGGLGLAASIGLFILSHRLVRWPQPPRPDLSHVPSLTLLPSLLMGAIVAGISEEAGFRGYMQGPLERRYGPAAAIAVTSVAFGLAHLTHGTFLPAILFDIGWGALYGLLTYWSGSIGPAIVLHSSADTIEFFAAWKFPPLKPTPLVWMTGPDAFLWLNCIMVVLLGGASVWAFRRLAQTHLNPKQIPGEGVRCNGENVSAPHPVASRELRRTGRRAYSVFMRRTVRDSRPAPLDERFALLATIDPISRSRAMVKSALTISLYLFSLCL